MEALAEASVDDLLEFTANFDASKGTFLSPSSAAAASTTSSHHTNISSAVRYVTNKLVKAAHPPDVKGGGNFDINRGQPLSDTFTGMIDALTGELLHGKRSYILTGETYEGPFFNGVRHGEGAIVTNFYFPKYSAKESSLPTITSESRYYGSYQNDRPHHGTIVISSQGLGFTYHGPFMNSKPHGENGILVKPCGYKYHGGFKNGLFHGHASETEESHLRGIYEGEFVSGMRQGYGIYAIKKDKPTSYVGDNNCEEVDKGEDEVDEYLYKGQWNANLKQGEGEEIIHGKEYYRGQFHMNERHGYGSLTFVQNLEDNERDSDSTNDVDELDPSEVIVKAEGQWRAGKPLNGIHGWTIFYANGDIYTGCVTDFVPEGNGLKRFSTRDIYAGQVSGVQFFYNMKVPSSKKSIYQLSLSFYSIDHSFLTENAMVKEFSFLQMGGNNIWGNG
jgi:hypothetical protein